MKILNIIGHPNKNSFNHAIHKTVSEFSLTSSDISVINIDLYEEDFDPIIRENETERNQQLVLEYQELISEADMIVITSPVWWFRLTPMIEGFFDKVLTPGFAYKFRPILTHGAPALPVHTIYVNSVKLRLVMGVYSFCFGWFRQKVVQFWSVPFVGQNDRMIYLEKVKSVMKRTYSKLKYKI
jgi:NAD(P)H dehydrogenase (quinone)